MFNKWVGIGSLVLTVIAPAPSRSFDSSVDPAGHARAVAEKELNRVSSEGSPIFEIEASAFRNATLGVPFLYYTSDARFLEYEQAAPQDMLNFTPWRIVVFPVRRDDVFLGIIKVKPQQSGEDVGFFGPADSVMISRVEDLSSSLHLEKGQRLSVVSTGLAGDFFVVEDGSAVYRMAPANERTIAMLGLKTDVSAVTFEPPGRFAVAIKGQLARAREHPADAKQFQASEPLE